MIRVLIADDQSLVRVGVRTILEAAPDIEVVGDAATGTEAVRLAEQLKAHVVVMDLRMPKMDGVSATRRILATRPDSRVVILTTFAEDENVYSALEAGAIGFMVKDDDPQSLIGAVRHAASGDPTLAPAVLRRIVDQAVHARMSNVPPESLTKLTPREREILILVGTGLSNAEIARRLHIGLTTVKTHIVAVTGKLGVRNRVQAAVIAHRYGLVHLDVT